MEGSDTTSAIASGQKSEYSQSFGTAPGLESPMMQPKLTWRRNDSQILPPFLHDEIERPNKCQQTWPWKDRAHHSDIFEPETLHGKDQGQLKSSRKWPWQDRAAISHVFDGNNNYVAKSTENTHKPDVSAVPVAGFPTQCKSAITNKLQWPWQARAMTSDIFRHSDAPKQRKHKEYSWHQGKSTLNHKVDGNFDGVTQYMKDFNHDDSLQKNLGPRHGYKNLLKRRDHTPLESAGCGGGDGDLGDYDFVSETTKMGLDDAGDYVKDIERKLEENPKRKA